jgi:uncharacterized membrane protein YeaQ/YmgE (transglycosylase-associated protein family)
MFGFIWWMIIGLIAGALARLIIPGRQAMGWVKTMGLGLIGSIVGGLISTVVFGRDLADPSFHTSGLLMSTIGAAILLGAYVAYARRQAPHV